MIPQWHVANPDRAEDRAATVSDRLPLVSLILLSHDYERYVGCAIESVLAQTYPHWELIVVDGGSHDRSLEVIRSFDDPRITLVALTQNRGKGHDYNHAYAHCRGEFVGSFDADDYLEPERLAAQVTCFADRPELDVVGTFVTQVDALGRPIQGVTAAWVNVERDLNRPESWAMRDYLCTSSALLRRSAHDRVGGLNPALELAHDYELWLRCLLLGYRFYVIPEPLTSYRTHSQSLSDLCDESRLFLELAYLFAAYLGRHLLAGRNDLLARCERFFAGWMHGAGVDLETRLAVLRELASFARYPTDAEAFLTAFPARCCGEAWQRARTALARAERPDRARPYAAPGRRAPARKRLVVVDDYFPELTTAFRVTEFNHYLATLDCAVYSTHPAFSSAHRAYAALHPAHADRVRPFLPDEAADASLVYFTFLRNAHDHLPWLERHELPFAFTLYPGHGLDLHDPVCELALEEVCRSPLLRWVIATQQLTHDYLRDGGFCPPEKIRLIQGGVVPAAYYRAHPQPRRLFPGDKETLDICFVGFKYMPRGVDKGYDTFVAAAQELARLAPAYRFHVVGNFSPADVPLEELADRITFHPPQPTPFFPGFYAGMDLLLSPNVPFRLRAGAFDGFPTGCAVEAGLCGVAVFCCDELRENRCFRPDEELCIVPPRVEAIVRHVEEHRQDPQRLYCLGAAGQRRFTELFDERLQLGRRQALLQASM